MSKISERSNPLLNLFSSIYFPYCASWCWIFKIRYFIFTSSN
uniref:Uncharacterized protein n=1 Tax=Myoviridae sp. ctCo31 TaxID=2825053 RepID=A0A8S5UM58_9CAUD|nr:MAG TPA: hypothetical protein [Myoviridae sp. ctCo31]